MVDEGFEPGGADKIVEGAVVEVRIAGHQVVADGGVEETGLLRQVDDLLAPPFGNDLGQIDAVDQNLAPGRFQQADDQPGQGRLAGAVGAGDDQKRIRIQFQAQGFEKRRPLSGMGEAQVLELQGA